MNIRVEVSSLASTNQSGVASYTKLLTEALIQHNHRLYLHYFNFLRRQPTPNLISQLFVKEENIAVPLRVFAKLQSFNFTFPFDLILPKVDLTIFPNFVTWPTIHSHLNATVIHDLTYIYFPEAVEEKNLAHLKRVVPRSINKADFIITVSESVKKELITQFNIDDKKCIVTPIPPDNIFFKQVNDESRQKVKEKYAIPYAKYLYFIGNLEPRKNVGTLIDAYCALPNHIKSNYGLVLAGSKGWKNEKIRDKLSNAIKKGEKIIHIGYIDQKDSPALYQAASLFVMPSLYEGFGIPILEAMASQCRVVASNIPVLRETGGNNIIYADPESSASFSKAIRLALELKITQQLEQDYKRNLNRFSWDNNINQIESLSKELLGSR